MKILLVDPAADWSTRDVFVGLRDGLRENGHEVIEFRSGRMLAVFAKALHDTWKRYSPAGTRPSLADAALLVSERAVLWGLRHEPEWTVVVSGMYYHPDALIQARRAGLRTAVLLTESPYDFDKEVALARLADKAWTNERTAVAPLLEAGVPHASYLRHAFNPLTHGPDLPQDADAPAHDVLFVGTGFAERVELLAAVRWAEIGLEPALYGAWPFVGRRHPLRPHVRGSIIGNDAAAQLYRRAAVNLNLFRSSMGFGRKAPRIHGAESLGPRAYELAATGSFFVSERRPEVAETFGDLVPTFGSPEELEDLLRRWAPDDAGRQEIRAALPALMRGHSWSERASQVVSDLRAVGGADPVSTIPARDASVVGEPLGTRAPQLV